MDPLLVRIFDVDFYMCAPIQNVDVTFSQFRGTAIQQVPVIRIFGSTEEGRKICVHVHGVFPYFYIPYDGMEAANSLMYKIATNLDKAINVSTGHASSNTQHVYKIALVSGIPFYGYHSKKHQFFKVYLYNPLLIKRANNLLFNPSLLGNIYQPHETHLNFTLQFMMDYNLHGMSNIILSQVKFRQESAEIVERLDMTDEIIAKVSSCELECDTYSECILNRREIESGKLAANPGIAAIWEDEKQRRRNKNEDSQLPHYLSLDKTNVAQTESHEIYERALHERLSIISQDKEKDFNLSVYPAECPGNKRMANCSFIDFHSPQNTQSNVSYDSELDQTLTETLDITVDEDVQNLINVLKDLEKNVSVEEDSILSQVPIDEIEDFDGDPDMSLSLEATSNLLDETLKQSDLSHENIKNDKKVPKIPQLDGTYQDYDVFCPLYSLNLSPQSPPVSKFELNQSTALQKEDAHKNCLQQQIQEKSQSHITKGPSQNVDSNAKLVVKLKNILDVLPNDNIQHQKQKKSRCHITRDASQSLDWNPTLVVKLQNILDGLPRDRLDELISKMLLHSRTKSKDIDERRPKLHSLSKEINSLKDDFSKNALLFTESNDYFCAPNIGERVSRKNEDRRKIIFQKYQLSCCREVSVYLEKLHLPSLPRRGKDMPSLTTDYFSSDSEPEPKPKQPKKFIKKLNIESLRKIKRTIRRRVHTIKTMSIKREVPKVYLRAYKMVKKANKCLSLLEMGKKPTFRIIPGCKPYLFHEKSRKQIRTESEIEQIKHHIMAETTIVNSTKCVLKSMEEIQRAQRANEAKFFTNISSFLDHYTLNQFKPLEPNNNDESTRSRMLFLDGANDSASEDEGKNKKIRRSKKPERSYTPLPISTNPIIRGIPSTDSKQLTKMKRNDGNRINHKLIEPENCDNIEKIKRKISFDSKYQNETISEEKLTCAIRTTSHQNNVVNFESKIGQSDSLEVADKFPDTNNRNAEHLEENISTSELYDIIHGYHPQEGTSKTYCGKTQLESTSQHTEEKLPSGENSNDFDLVGENKTIAIPINEDISTVDDLLQPSTSPMDMFYGQKENSVEPSEYSSNDTIFYKPQYKPPTRNDIEQTLNNFKIPNIRSQEPFYSNANDVTSGLEIGYNVVKIKTRTSVDAADFESNFDGIDSFRKKYFPKTSKTDNHFRYSYCKADECVITPIKKPPSRAEVTKWLKEKSVQPEEIIKTPKKTTKIYLKSSQDGLSDDSLDLSLTLTPLTPKSDSSFNQETSDLSQKTETSSATPKSSRSATSSPVLTSRRRRRKNTSIALRKSALLSHSSENSGIISGVTMNNTYGFKHSLENYQNARPSVVYEHITVFSMELHVNTRGDFKPNPQYDTIQAIFYSIFNDVEENTKKPRKTEGMFVINRDTNFLSGIRKKIDVKYVENELELFEKFTKFVTDWDPDILIGYEIQMLSWGYFIERCFHLGINIIPEISRIKDKHLKFNEKETGDLRVTGRVVLDFWRLLRHEVALQSYTLQSTVFEILQKRIPKYTFKDLTNWWDHPTDLYRHRVVNYYLTCVNCVLNMMEQLDLIGRTSELARLFGIQFFEVLSRGSQFRVESMMLRLAKPMNYVAVSPSVQQRANMKAPEYIALVLEPESKLYTDPVIVLDFQSLYPSIVIAYNYCFSTCIGRVDLLGKNEPFQFGATNYKISRERVKYLLKKNQLHFSPCGVGFVKKNVRDGIMPRMLREILDTRLMVKKSMKENKDDTLLQKVLHNRQLGLKLIANVTYGYTAANFSGRMPSVEIADSIVSKARETLQRTIALVDGNKEWGVRVVYGDTDSLFVHCPGKTREEAFVIGEQIVEAVGKENPDPMKLKLEKVYQPCILQTKKRYVGYMYESPDQKEPTYDAKGIETVRRDGCAAVSKMLEKSLRILFETKDVSNVKKYCLKQFNKIIMGRISIQDLTFAKEFRGLTGYRPGACVPSLELAKKWIVSDKRAEPRRGERVPYVIISGPPGLPLIKLVRSPYELINDPALRPNALYYITRVIIPPLNRCFHLIGADLNAWFQQMPRKQLQYLPTTSSSPTKRSTISQYFISTLCAVCGIHTLDGLCDDCKNRPQETVLILNEKIRHWEASYNNCKLICSACTQILDEPKCVSLDCPVFYRLNRTNRDLQQSDHIRLLLSQHFDIF